MHEQLTKCGKCPNPNEQTIGLTNEQSNKLGLTKQQMSRGVFSISVSVLRLTSQTRLGQSVSESYVSFTNPRFFHLAFNVYPHSTLIPDSLHMKTVAYPGF